VSSGAASARATARASSRARPSATLVQVAASKSGNDYATSCATRSSRNGLARERRAHGGEYSATRF